MTERTPDQDAIQAAEDLTGVLGKVVKELQRLNAYGRRNRRLVVLAFVSVAIDVALTVALVLVYGAVRQNHSEAQAARATSAAEHSSLLTACLAGNQTRAAEVGLWVHIYDLGVNKKTTPPKALREDNELIAYVRATFAPRDCARIYKLP